MPPSTARDQLATSHEDRIQRLETDIPELTAQVTVVALQQRQLGEKMDGLLTTMEKHARASAESFAKVDTRLAPVEKSQERAALIKSWFGKALVPVFLVVAAVLGKFGEAIFTFLFGG